LKKAYPGTIVVAEWVFAVHDWQDHQDSMTNFAGIKKSCRKMGMKLGIPAPVAVGIFEAEDQEEKLEATENNTKPVPLGTSYENASDTAPSGITFGSSWAVHDSIPIFTRVPKIPTTMLAHSEDGLQAALKGIATCRSIIEKSDESNPDDYFIQRKTGDNRPYAAIKAERMASLDSMWIPDSVSDMPPGFNPRITAFPATIRGTNPAGDAAAQVMAEEPVIRQRMHFGSSAQMPVPVTTATEGWMAIIVCKERGVLVPTPALARIVSVEDFDDEGKPLWRLRWYNDPTPAGKCKHYGYEKLELFGPPEHKIAHCAPNLVTAAGTATSFVQLTKLGKKWWELCANVCESGKARI
jgi:hypothetical protein